VELKLSYPGISSQAEWASVVEAATASTPVAAQRRNRFTALGSITDDDERQPFTTVQPRRNNKRSYRQTAAAPTS